MGLDMYLERKNKNTKPNVKGVWEEVMYWRKANQIRDWFLTHLDEGVANCEYSFVKKENLESLIEDCKTVLADHSKASELLPTSSGFLFGSVDYDEWYYQDLEDTVEGLTKVIEETDWDNQDVAYYEWW